MEITISSFEEYTKPDYVNITFSDGRKATFGRKSIAGGAKAYQTLLQVLASDREDWKQRLASALISHLPKKESQDKMKKIIKEVSAKDAAREIASFFVGNDVQIQKAFSFKRFVQYVGLDTNQALTALVNLEDENVIVDIANGNYSSFDIDDRSIFNDSYYDMMSDLGLGDDEEEEDDEDFDEAASSSKVNTAGELLDYMKANRKDFLQTQNDEEKWGAVYLADLEDQMVDSNFGVSNKIIVTDEDGGEFETPVSRIDLGKSMNENIFKENKKMKAKNIEMLTKQIEEATGKKVVLQEAESVSINTVGDSTVEEIIPADSQRVIEEYVDSTLKELKAKVAELETIKFAVSPEARQSSEDWKQKTSGVQFLITQLERVSRFVNNTLQAKKFDKNILDKLVSLTPTVDAPIEALPPMDATMPDAGMDTSMPIM